MHYHCDRCCVLSTENKQCPACGHADLKPIKIEVHSNSEEKK